MNKEFLKMQKLAGVNEITVNSPMKSVPIFVVLSPTDGLVIEYSLDTSSVNQERLKQKYSLTEQDRKWYGVFTLDELLGGKLKSSYTEVSY
jgi:hypothetical protein